MESESRNPSSAALPPQAAEPIPYASANLPKPVFLPTRDRVLTSRLSRAMGIGFTAAGLILGLLAALAASDMSRSLAWLAVGAVVGLYLVPGLVLWLSAGPVKRGGLAPLIFVLIGCLWIAASTLLTFLGEAWIVLNGTLLEGVWVRLVVACIFFIAIGFLLYHGLRAIVLGANAADADGKVPDVKEFFPRLSTHLKPAVLATGSASLAFNLAVGLASAHWFIRARAQPELAVSLIPLAVLAACCGLGSLLAASLILAARHWATGGEIETAFLAKYATRRIILTILAVASAGWGLVSFESQPEWTWWRWVEPTFLLLVLAIIVPAAAGVAVPLYLIKVADDLTWQRVREKRRKLTAPQAAMPVLPGDERLPREGGG